jgi:hypothetical protein
MELGKRGKVRESNGRTKVKYTHSRDTLRNHFEHQLRY